MQGSNDQTASSVKLSEVISALSYALDITEGQPKGHAARSCMLGMRIGQDLRLSGEEMSALFYALLLKDLGCSSNAGKMCYLFGSDDRTVKRGVKTINWTNPLASTAYFAQTVAVGGSIGRKLRHFARLAVGGKKQAKALVELRCDRGANIARELGFPDLTALAIRSLDEHWDGRGHPQGQCGEEIPLLARVLSIAQTAEVFISERGIQAALEMAQQRCGTWFDPQMVQIFLTLKGDGRFWQSFYADDAAAAASRFEPVDSGQRADEDRLDRIAGGFSQVIDAKSPWTFRHSEGVAKISCGMGEALGMGGQEIRILHRAALLHDVGKLGISNLILDKPGKLTAEEMTEMKRHTLYTHEILTRMDGFRNLADLAASHHEQLDGKGYHRGWDAPRLDRSSRILAVADIFEALTARRPYRQDLSDEEVTTIMKRRVGTALCPQAYEALEMHLARGGYNPAKLSLAA